MSTKTSQRQVERRASAAAAAAAPVPPTSTDPPRRLSLAGGKKARATSTAPPRRLSVGGAKKTAEAAGKGTSPAPAPAPAVTGGSPGAAAALLSLAAAAFSGHTEDATGDNVSSGAATPDEEEEEEEQEVVSLLTQDSETVEDEKESFEDKDRDASVSGTKKKRANPTYSVLFCVGFYWTRKENGGEGVVGGMLGPRGCTFMIDSPKTNLSLPFSSFKTHPAVLQSTVEQIIPKGKTSKKDAVDVEVTMDPHGRPEHATTGTNVAHLWKEVIAQLARNIGVFLT